MALHAINAGQPLTPAIRAAAAGLAPGAPVVAMVHGFRFSPASTQHDPHRHILSLTPTAGERRAVSWPAGLGFTATGDEGLALAFGWEARGKLRHAYAQAGEVGADLAALGLGLVQRRSCAGGFGLSLDPPQQRFATFLDEGERGSGVRNGEAQRLLSQGRATLRDLGFGIDERQAARCVDDREVTLETDGAGFGARGGDP